jgi:hypothetical protein
MKPHRGTLILVLGILGLVLCGIFTAIPAWVMASSDLKQMDAGTMDPSGRSLTSAGRILGIIGTILGALGILIALAFVVFTLFGIIPGARP